MTIDERIAARITELEQIERDTAMQLTVIRNLLHELRTLIAPPPDAPEDRYVDYNAEPVMSGVPLGEQDA